MPPLWVLLASVTVWVAPEQLTPWIKLEPAFQITQEKNSAEVKIEEGEAPLPQTISFVKEGAQEEGASLRYIGPASHPLAQLDWNGAPRVSNWSKLTPAPDETILVETTDGDPFLVVGKEHARFALSLSEKNRQFFVWPALPYALYALVSELGGEAPLAFHEWEASPVPTRSAKLPVYLGLSVLLLLSCVLFFVARRAGNRAAYDEAKIQSLFGASDDKNEPWSKISFRRPLAGFLYYLVMQAFLLLSLGWVDNVYANHVQPFPWVTGTRDLVNTTFEVIWYLFDLGTRDAFIRSFAERKHKDPKGALRCAQFFVWWQLLTGAFQIALVTFLVIEAMPSSTYALYAWPLFLQATGQWPGMQNIFSAYFQGTQRFDHAQRLDLFVTKILGTIMPIVLVLYFRSWGAARPQYGEAFGAIIGLSVASYTTQLGNMAIGAWLARSAKLPIKPLFYGSFDAKTAKEMLSYGAFLTLGQLPNRLSFAVNNFILKAYLPNYSESAGVYSKANESFLTYFKWPLSFYGSGVPAFAEAISAKKMALTRYYIARFWQYGSLLGAILFALVMGTGSTFVTFALAPQWHRISDYLLLLSLIGLLLGPSWISDALQQGAGRPGLFGVLVAGEQLARIGFFFVLVRSFGFQGFLMAIFFPLLLKCVIAWSINLKKIVRPTLSFWVHLIGPLLVGLVLWALFFLCSLLVSSAVGASILLFAGGLGALLLGFFLAGLFGIFDRAGLDEMKEAAHMTGSLLRYLVVALPLLAGLGYRLSPWKERFSLSLSVEAAKEASEIEASMRAAKTPEAT